MKLHIHHCSTYTYADKVGFSEHKFYLRPREDHHTRIQDFQLSIFPNAEIKWVRDAAENCFGKAYFTGTSKQMVVDLQMTVAQLQENPFDFVLETHALNHPLQYTPGEREYLLPYFLSQGTDSAPLLDWIKTMLPVPPTETLPLLTQLNQLICQNITYKRREEMGCQNPGETLQLKSGSCRDMASLYMALCRCLGFAARFVSGYLYEPPTSGLTQTNRAAGAMHAWTEIYLPGAGWKGFDPTNGILAGNTFVPVAVALHPEATTPIQGAYVHLGKVESTLTSEVVITEIP